MSECEACRKAAKEILDNPMLRGLGEMGVIVFAIQGKYHDAEIARLKEERDQLGRKCSETKTEMDRALEWASCILDSWRTDYRENFRFHSPEADLYSTDEFLTRYPSNYLKDLARRALEGGKP